MRIAKPLLLVTTPLGVAGAIYEAYRLAGGLVLLMVALLSLVSVAVGTLVMTIRREAAADAQRARAQIASEQAITSDQAVTSEHP